MRVVRRLFPDVNRADQRQAARFALVLECVLAAPVHLLAVAARLVLDHEVAAHWDGWVSSRCQDCVRL